MHELWLCPRETLTAAFEAAGFDVRWWESGFRTDRGLLVGTRRGA